MTAEFVVFSSEGTAIDWIDPYLEHRAGESPGTYLVDNGFDEYTVVIPHGGHFEIRGVERA